jgi:hypothetical protein
VVALAAATWVRAWPVAIDPLLLDEYGTLWASGGDDAKESFRRALAIHGQTPAYYLLVHATIAAVGESLLTLRLPSLLCGLTVPLLGYVGASRAFGRRAGLAALLLLAVHPELVSQARAARPYPPAAAAALVSFLGVERACATGAVGARLLAWGGAVLATYFHPLFAPLLLAVPAAALADRRAWPAAAVARDGALAALVVSPALAHTAHLFARRHELAFIADLDLGTIMGTVFPPIGVLVLLAAALRARRVDTTRWSGPVVFAAVGTALPVLLALVMWLLGASISAERYLSLALLCGLLLFAGALARLPRRAAAAALVLLAVPNAFALPEVIGRPRFLYVQDTLAAAGAGAGDLVLVQASYIESQLVTDPERWTHDRERFVLAPYELAPGRTLLPREYVVLPERWVDAQVEPYLASRVAPRLAGRRRFFVLGTVDHDARLSAWIEARFGDHFRSAWRSDAKNVFMVRRFEAGD